MSAKAYLDLDDAEVHWLCHFDFYSSIQKQGICALGAVQRGHHLYRLPTGKEVLPHGPSVGRRTVAWELRSRLSVNFTSCEMKVYRHAIGKSGAKKR